MATTSRLGLVKPSATELLPHSLSSLNSNADVIDSAMGFLQVTSGTRPVSPYRGQLIEETDTGALRWWNGTAWAVLYQEVNDWHPELKGTSSHPTTITTNGWWVRTGNLVSGGFRLTIGPGMGSGQYYLDAPVPVRNNQGGSFGRVKARHSGVSTHQLAIETLDNARLGFFASVSGADAVTPTVPVTWANGSGFSGNFTYMAAP